MIADDGGVVLLLDWSVFLLVFRLEREECGKGWKYERGVRERYGER